MTNDALQALMLHSFVTLTGSADWQHQRDNAELLTASVPGVAGIDDGITLTCDRAAVATARPE